MAKKNNKKYGSSGSGSGGGETLVRARRVNGLIIALVSAGVAFIGVAEVYITNKNTDKEVVAASPDFARVIHGEPELVRASFVPKDFDKNTATKSRSFSSFFSSLGSAEVSAVNQKREKKGTDILKFLRKKPERN